MTPSEFIKKWKAANLKERSAAQEHFIDLCRLLGEQTPAQADPDGEWYGFERGASKLTGGDGWADVWKRGHFSWEYKGKHKDLKAAYVQLQQYSWPLKIRRFSSFATWTGFVFIRTGPTRSRTPTSLRWMIYTSLINGNASSGSSVIPNG